MYSLLKMVIFAMLVYRSVSKFCDQKSGIYTFCEMICWNWTILEADKYDEKKNHHNNPYQDLTPRPHPGRQLSGWVAVKNHGKVSELWLWTCVQTPHVVPEMLPRQNAEREKSQIRSLTSY